MSFCVTRWAMCGMLAAACAGGNMRLAAAKDHFLAIGGGYDASGNPASLERDLKFASATIAATMISTNVATPAGSVNVAPKPAVEIYFADGDDPARDVQYVDGAAAKACPPIVRVLAGLFGAPDAVAFRYRDHTLEGVVGPTDYEVMERRFQELGRELASGDRLFVIAAGHGGEAYDRAAESDEEPDEVERGATEGPADRQNDEEEDDGAESNGEDASINPYDTSLLLWNQDELLASELCRWLDELPRDIEVVLVMGQCYSGGFANVIFNGADAKLGLSPAARCGFFSQLYDRPAAGCAADLDDEDVHEYSSYFWAALGGKTRDGAAVTADYDKSGAVSLAEAHAYAVIESDTLDVPVRTSEALLRAYSRLGGPFVELQEGPTAGAAVDEVEAEGDVADNATDNYDANAGLREPRGPLAQLAALARPDQHAILEQLPAKVAGKPLRTVEDVRVELGTALEKVDDANEALDAAMTATDEALIVAQNEAYVAWPELHFRESTAAAELLAAQGEEIAARVEAMGSYVTLLAAREQEKKLTAEADAAEAAAAQLERLLRTIEDVVLAENLKIVASPEIFARYEELVRMEERGLQ